MTTLRLLQEITSTLLNKIQFSLILDDTLIGQVFNNEIIKDYS